MPNSIKFYYFGARGRGEALRHLLKLGNVEHEDVVINEDTWPSLKDEMPLGKVPVLEVDGVKIGESLAIARYIGKEYGLAAKTNLENARLDMIADFVVEAMNSQGIKEWPMVLLDRIECTNKIDYFKNKVLPQLDNYASNFEKFLVENGSNALLSGDKVTWVDVFAAEFFSKFVDFGESNCLDAYPHIQNLIARIHNIPVIRDHIAKRGEKIA